MGNTHSEQKTTPKSLAHKHELKANRSKRELIDANTIYLKFGFFNLRSIIAVQRGDKVCDVKKTIEERLKVPYHQQRLFQKGEFAWYGCRELTDDEEALSSKSDCILIERNIDNVLFVTPDFAELYTIEYNPADTIADVKSKIHWIETADQGLICKGKRLNDKKTLADYNIQKQSTLHLKVLTTITIKLLNGDSISLEVEADGCETIESVKLLICEKLSIPVEEQELQFEGKEMQDDKSLNDYWCHNSNFLLVPRECPEMQLFIKTTAGHIISLREYPYNTIADLKTQIKEREGIPSDQQQLIFSGKHLEEVELLGECKIQPECTLYLTTRMHDRFQISVTVSDERNGARRLCDCTVEVELSDSFAHVKSKLLDKLLEIPFREKVVLYYEKQELEDTNTIKDYGIRCSSVLDLSIHDQSKYSYTASNGVEIPIVHHIDTCWPQAVPDSQLFINPVPPCTAFQMPIFVRACAYKLPQIISIGVSPTSTVEDMASEIHNALEGIEYKKYTLTYAGNKLDEGTQLLSNCDIQRESVVFLEHIWEMKSVDIFHSWNPTDKQQLIFSKIFDPYRQIGHSYLHGLLQFPILVQMAGKQRIPIIIEPHTTAADLKTNVQRRAAIPVSQQYVLFSGKMLEDENVLIDYGVHRECILQLLRQEPIDITVFVKSSRKGNIVTLLLNPTASVRQVKTCIQETKQIPFDQQQLTFAGIVLENERSLLSYDIDDQCTLYLRLDDTYLINIYTAQGQTISLNVAPTDMISNIKSGIQISEGIIPDQQELFFGNVRLDDSRTVQSYGIWSMETLMLMKLTDKPTVFIKNITGEVMILEHCLTKTIAAMKVDVYNKRKIPPEGQVMFFRGTRMEDTQTLSNYSIQNCITIHLVPELSENFKVCVKGKTGKVISLKASPIHTIENVKLMIWHRLGILPDEQYLYCDDCYSDKQLSNSQCLSECGIRHESMLLLLQKPCTLSVRTTTGNVITLTWPQRPKVTDIKFKLCRENNVEAQNLRLFWNARELNDTQSLIDYSILSSLLNNSAHLQITNKPVLFVRCYTSNRIVALDYHPENTIAQLQHHNQIKEQEEQLLVFDDKILNDKQTIESYDIQENHILTLIPEEVKLFVTTQTKMWAIFDAHLLDSVEDVKDQIQQEWRIPNKQQKLSLDGLELNSSKTLRSYHIQNESILLLSLLPWEPDQIAIQMPSKTIVLEVNLQQDTTDDVKAKIESSEGIPAAHQCLYFKVSKMLRSTQLLDDCGIRNHSSLCLLLKPSTLLVKSHHSGRVIQLEWAEHIQSVTDLKRKLQEVEGVPIEKQLIYHGHTVLESDQVLLDYSILSQFRARGSLTHLSLAYKPVLLVKCYESGEITAINYDENCTMLDIKQKSCKAFGVQINQCCLAKPFFWTCTEGMEDRTLLSYNVQEGNTIDLVPHEIKLFIQIQGTPNIISMDVNTFNTSSDVERLIWNKLGPNHKHLEMSVFESTINGSRLYGRLYDMHIQSRSVLHVLLEIVYRLPGCGASIGWKYRILIKTLSGKTIFLTVWDSTTVRDLKCMIEKTESGAPLHTQRLIFNGKELIDDEQTLRYYGIGDAATVDLLVKGHSLLIKMHMGKTITVEYDLDDTVLSVKEKIQKKAAILPSRQQLVLGGTGKELKNDDVLKDCNVTANSTLNLILKRRMQIQVVTLVGETHSITLAVQAEDTVESVKLLIQVYTRAPPDQQVLYLAGCELNDWMTLSDYRIQHHSNLHLVLLQLHVRTPSGEEVTVRYSESETVAAIKAQLYADTRMLPQEQRLLFCDQELEDQHILGHYHIKNGHTLYLEHIQGGLFSDQRNT